MPDFRAQVSNWARQSEDRLVAVFREATQRVANEVRVPVGAGGNMPVVTGNLRRSLGISLSAMPTVQGRQFEADPSTEISLTIANSQLGQTIYLGFQAVYARYQENRYGFVRLTAQRWEQIVQESAQIIRDRTEGR
jgi:hypothetical protein